MKKLFLMLGLVILSGFNTIAQEEQVNPPRVLILLAEGFNVQEFYGGWVPLAALGYQIDVAGIQSGTIPANPKKPSERDTVAQISLDQVDAAEYLGLFIPGGYSPGNLEKEELALEIVKDFMTAGKPVASVCHGPRLLMRTGTLQDRNFTCLYTLPNEIADLWIARTFKNYLDQSVVVDGNLVTSRYPNDMPEFSVAMLRLFAEAGGIPVRLPSAEVIIIEKESTPHQRWTYSLLRSLSLSVSHIDISKTKEHEAVAGAIVAVNCDTSELEMHPDVMTVIKNAAVLFSPGNWQPDSFTGTVHAIPEVSSAEFMSAVYQAACEQTDAAVISEKLTDTTAPEKITLARTAFEPDDEYAAVLALREGFDEAAAKQWLEIFRKANKEPVIIVGPQEGTVPGMNGGQADVTVTYAEEINLQPDAWIVAPGGLWPEDDAGARQREDAAWLSAQGERDRQREEWLIERYNAGAYLVLTGFDALRLGRRKEFKGMQFASSEQTVWSFGRDGGRYQKDSSAIQSAQRLISCRADAIAEAAELLSE